MFKRDIQSIWLIIDDIIMLSWVLFTLQHRPEDLGPCSLFLYADTYDDPSPSHKKHPDMLFKQHIPRYSFELQQDPLRKLGTQIIEPFSQKLEFRDIETCKPGVFRISTLMLKQIPKLIDDQNRFVKT